MWEMIAIGLLTAFYLLGRIEASALEEKSYSEFAWLARAIKLGLAGPLLGILIALSGPLSSMVCFVKHSGRNAWTWDYSLGAIVIIICVAWSISTIINRESVQQRLEQGTLQPLD